jgi:hypothetical protein
MKGQGHGRNFLAPFVSGVVVIKMGEGFQLLRHVSTWGWTHVSRPTVPFNAKSAHLFRHFPSVSKKLASFLHSFTVLAGGFAVLVVLGSGGFLRGLLHRQLFPSLVSQLLPFFRFLFLSFFRISVVLSCSWGVRKRGFFYFYSGRFCSEVECCIACRTFVLSF